MQLIYKKYKLFFQVVTVSVCFAFISENLVWAAGFNTVERQAVPAAVATEGAAAFDLSRVSGDEILNSIKSAVSESFGSVSQQFVGGKEKVIIHIQDSHANYEAQTNLVRILKSIKASKIGPAVKLIALEGAAGKLNTAPYIAYPDKDVRRGLTDYFMKKGFLTGPEAYSIETGQPSLLYGIEERPLYVENLLNFRKAQKVKPEMLSQMGGIASAIGALSKQVFSREMNELLAKKSEFDAGTLSITEFCGVLCRMAEKQKIGIADKRNIELVRKILKMEGGIDFRKVDFERILLTEKLSAVLSKQDAAFFVAKSLEFRLGQISSIEYYEILRNLLKKSGTDITSFKDLSAYLTLVDLYKQIDKSALAVETDSLFDSLKASYIKNEEQRELDGAMKDYRILNNLVKLELTSDEYRYYAQNKDGITPGSLIKYITGEAGRRSIPVKIAPGAGSSGDSMTAFESFYITSNKRDKAIVANTLGAMDRSKTKIAVLVTGGFHTKGMTEELAKKGVTYIVISPRMTQFGAETPYLSLMMNEFSPFDDIIARIGTRLAPQLLTAVKPIEQWADGFLLRKWKIVADLMKVGVMSEKDKKAFDEIKKSIVEIDQQITEKMGGVLARKALKMWSNENRSGEEIVSSLRVAPEKQAEVLELFAKKKELGDQYAATFGKGADALDAQAFENFKRLIDSDETLTEQEKKELIDNYEINIKGISFSYDRISFGGDNKDILFLPVTFEWFRDAMDEPTVVVVSIANEKNFEELKAMMVESIDKLPIKGMELWAGISPTRVLAVDRIAREIAGKDEAAYATVGRNLASIARSGAVTPEQLNELLASPGKFAAYREALTRYPLTDAGVLRTMGDVAGRLKNDPAAFVADYAKAVADAEAARVQKRVGSAVAQLESIRSGFGEAAKSAAVDVAAETKAYDGAASIKEYEELRAKSDRLADTAAEALARALKDANTAIDEALKSFGDVSGEPAVVEMRNIITGHLNKQKEELESSIGKMRELSERSKKRIGDLNALLEKIAAVRKALVGEYNKAMTDKVNPLLAQVDSRNNDFSGVEVKERKDLEMRLAYLDRATEAIRDARGEIVRAYDAAKAGVTGLSGEIAPADDRISEIAVAVADIGTALDGLKRDAEMAVQGKDTVRQAMLDAHEADVQRIGKEEERIALQVRAAVEQLGAIQEAFDRAVELCITDGLVAAGKNDFNAAASILDLNKVLDGVQSQIQVSTKAVTKALDDANSALTKASEDYKEVYTKPEVAPKATEVSAYLKERNESIARAIGSAQELLGQVQKRIDDLGKTLAAIEDERKKIEAALRGDINETVNPELAKVDSDRESFDKATVNDRKDLESRLAYLAGVSDAVKNARTALKASYDIAAESVEKFKNAISAEDAKISEVSLALGSLGDGIGGINDAAGRRIDEKETVHARMLAAQKDDEERVTQEEARIAKLIGDAVEQLNKLQAAFASAVGACVTGEMVNAERKAFDAAARVDDYKKVLDALKKLSDDSSKGLTEALTEANRTLADARESYKEVIGAGDVAKKETEVAAYLAGEETRVKRAIGDAQELLGQVEKRIAGLGATLEKIRDEKQKLLEMLSQASSAAIIEGRDSVDALNTDFTMTPIADREALQSRVKYLDGVAEAIGKATKASKEAYDAALASLEAISKGIPAEDLKIADVRDSVDSIAPEMKLVDEKNKAVIGEMASVQADMQEDQEAEKERIASEEARIAMQMAELTQAVGALRNTFTGEVNREIDAPLTGAAKLLDVVSKKGAIGDKKIVLEESQDGISGLLDKLKAIVASARSGIDALETGDRFADVAGLEQAKKEFTDARDDIAKKQEAQSRRIAKAEDMQKQVEGAVAKLEAGAGRFVRFSERALDAFRRDLAALDRILDSIQRSKALYEKAQTYAAKEDLLKGVAPRFAGACDCRQGVRFGLESAGRPCGKTAGNDGDRRGEGGC